MAAVAILGLGIVGWINAPVRPEPFDEPLPPLSLGWWLYTPVDPGIADLDMVPAGGFGSFLPRAIARNIRTDARFAVADIADAYVLPDGSEILVSLKTQAGRADFQYSANAGRTWSGPPSVPIRCSDPGQSAKIQQFGPKATNLAFDCFPTALPNEGLDAGPATTSVRVGAGTTPDALWLTTRMGPVWIAGGGATLFKVTNKTPLTIARPQSDNRILIASADGFTMLTLRRVQLRGPPIAGNLNSISPKGDGLGTLPPNLAAPGPQGTPGPQEAFPGAFNRASTAQVQQGLPNVQQRAPVQQSAPADDLSLPEAGAWTEIRDPAHPGGNIPIRTIRVSNDGKSIVVAQAVARDAGVLVSHDGGQSWSRLAYATGAPPWVVFVAFPLALLAAAGAARQLIRTPPGEPSIADEAATDRPIGLHDADALQFEPIARGLLMFIRNPQTEPPVTIAVTGPWGSGKTSLMTILRDLLREHDARPVWFNAWHHQKEEHLLAALIENIRRQAIPSIGTWAGLFFRLRLLRRRFIGRLGVMLVLLAAALFVIGSYLSLSEQTTKQMRAWLLQEYLTVTEKTPAQPSAASTAPAKSQNEEGDLLLALIALLPSGLAVPVLLFGVLKNLQAFPRAKPEQLLGAGGKAKGDFAAKLSFRYRFEREFSETAAALRGSASPGLIVFIDDLDRCHAQNVVELLEAINFIVSAGECFIIVGMAKDQIRRSILASYKSEFVDLPKDSVRDGDIEAARRRFADRYLEKLINIEVPVPQPSAGQIMSLLTGEAKRPELPPGVAVRRRLRLLYDNGPVILAAGFLVALFIWVHPYLARFSLSAPVPAPAVAVAPAATGTPQGPGAPALTVPQVYESDKDLAGAEPRAGFPWSQAALGLALLVAAGAYLARLWVLAKQRPASDSQPFRQALALWNPVIFLAARTPRAVKQYKNMLRYQAMRLRALQSTAGAGRIVEPDLVALGAISLADRALLAGAIPPAGKPISLLVKDAVGKAPPDGRDVLEQISASLNRRQVDADKAAALESSISQYLALLPPKV